MAIWHLRAQIIGRSSGKSVIGAAAYRSASSLYSEHTDLQFDYSAKQGVAFSEILTPEGAPAWMQDREALWNGVERFEKRKDATLARDIEVALPAELTLAQNQDLIREYLQDNFVKLGMVADYSMHETDSHNPHAHIMLTLRPVEGDSFGKKAREWNDKGLFEHWRAQWAVTVNKHLALNGIEQRISHLSYAEQGIDLEPTMHRGYMARENAQTLERFEKAKAIEERNYERLLTNPEIALDLLTHHEAVFSHQELARLVHRRTRNADEFAKLKLAIESCDQLVRLGMGLDGKEYFTSRKTLITERQLLEQATRLAQSKLHQLDPKQLQFVTEHYTLNVDQQAAFDHILSDADLSLVVGFAGTGKSHLMAAVREAYESQGYRVVGTTLSGRAAEGLSQSAGIDSRTIARNLIDWENGRYQLDSKTVLVIDEIGMVGTRQLQAILAEADRVGAKVIGCGDPEQIPPIEAGSPFRFLLERMRHVFLKQIMRQKTAWQREATFELSTRQHSKALDRYAQHGHIHVRRDRETARLAVVDTWMGYHTANPSKQAIMMAYRNVDVLAMNLMARERLKATGQLTGEGAAIQTKAFGQLEFLVGDRVMFLRNDNEIRVKNGLLGCVEHIDGTSLTIKMDRGDTLVIDTQAYQDLGYGYAATIHKLQGATVDQAFALVTPHLDRFLTNVMLDRHRDGVDVFYGQDDFNSFNNLKRTLSRGESKILATEFAQARGIDYPLEQDQAAQVESQTDFNHYYQTLAAESLPVRGTLAETYLAQQHGLTEVEQRQVRFHPAVWERETQSYMPALLAQAMGQGGEGEKAPHLKGIQVTFLDETTAEKASLTHPVRYSGSPDAIVMLQKPSQPDARWFVAADLETGLALSKADSTIRVACLATQERFDRAPLQGNGQKPLIFCANETTPTEVVEKAIAAFTEKGFKVQVAKPEKTQTFTELLNHHGKAAVTQQLAQAKPAALKQETDGEVRAVTQRFAELDNKLREAEQKHPAFRTVATEAIDQYVVQIGKNAALMAKLKITTPKLAQRITAITDQEREIEL